MNSSIFNLALTVYHDRMLKENKDYPSADMDVQHMRKNPDQVPDRDIATAADIDKSCKEQGIQYVTIHDDLYPAMLKDLKREAPQVLYIKTSTPLAELFKGDFVAIVGTRDPSSYGISSCRKILRHLAGERDPKPTIVSGLALGIDITAHAAALEAGMKTIAVLPCGLDEIYPKVHTPVAEKIATTPGCALVSPFPPGTAPTAYNFFARNPVIAALSNSTVIVESRVKGGAKIIARAAYQIERKVFAIPGRIDDIRSDGCNELIAEGIADILCDKNMTEI